ncbi:MAG: hypothetical protein K0S54_2479 [Alphaproteobacteria bacterium]|nr:hypothetical protein [Alphaproteobacteria bacterium]
MKNTVFIHTNEKQRLGALVARHALLRNSANPAAFDVRIVRTEDFAFLSRREGQRYLREGKMQVWKNDDLQSFPPLRFAVPELMGYVGRAIVIDPDVFAVGDVNELFERDMGGRAILARRMESDSRRPLHWASSVMLLDCGRLKHWQAERDFSLLFEAKRDYRDWNWLLLEPEGSVGELESAWNDFDTLTPETRMLHNTHRRTQPWKTGLPADFTTRGTTRSARWNLLMQRTRRLLGSSEAAKGYYKPHPDPAQERLFFTLLGECLANGSVSEALVREEIERGHLRPDAFSLLERRQSAA